MEDLKRLVDIISKRKQRQYPLLDLKSSSENSSKENIFYRHIKKGEVQSDDEAANMIYGVQSEDDRFRMLKSRLKQKLLNHIFFLDFKENNQKITFHFEQECLQQLHQAKILQYSNETRLAKNLLLKSLTTSERCEFTKYKIASFELLLEIYSESHQPHLFDDVVDKLSKIRRLYAKEEEVRENFYSIKMLLEKSVNSRKKNLDNAEKFILQLEKQWRETKSYNIFEYLFQLKILHHGITGDFEGIIAMLREVEKNKYSGITLNKYRLDKKQLKISMAMAYYRSWQIEKCISHIEKNLVHFNEPFQDWFVIYEIYFLSLVFQKKYKLANKIVDQVLKNEAIEQQSQDELSKWKLYKTYLLVGLEHILDTDDEIVIGDIPIYDKDHEGYNVAVLIIQFLYQLEQGSLPELALRRDEIKIYMANHFKENFSNRSRTMYKLLNIVVECELDAKKIQLKSKYLIKKLKENHVVGTAYEELEIVPYQYIWEWVIAHLND